MKDAATATFGVWDEEPSGAGSSRPRKGPCQPYHCRELLAFLEANPSKDSPLLRRFIRMQQRPAALIQGRP